MADISHPEERPDDVLPVEDRPGDGWESRLEAFQEGELQSASYRVLRSFLPICLFAAAWVWHARTVNVRSAEALMQTQFAFPYFLALVLLFLLWNATTNMIIPRQEQSFFSQEVAPLIKASFLCTAVAFLLKAFFSGWRLAAQTAAFSGAVLLAGSLLLLLFFFVYRVYVSHAITRKKQLVLVIGAGPRGQDAIRRFQRSPSHELLGCLDDAGPLSPAMEPFYLGGIEQLGALLKQHPVEAVVITLPVKSQYDQIQKAIFIAESVGVEIHHLANVFSTKIATRPQSLLKSPEFTVLRTIHVDPRQHVKRLVDITGALAVLALVWPVMIVVGLAVKLTSRGPMFFGQERYGLHRKRFKMYKFRSMIPDAEKRLAELEAQNEASGPVFKMRHDPRITPVGRFIRRTSLDELPQLFNILRGDMSLVGPRPLAVRDVTLFQEAWLLRRFSVKPGLTCLWQVNGRSNTTFDYWIRQDLAYIDEWSLTLDFNILLKTIPAVLKGSGAM